jgi:hypothetical protein
MRRRPGACIGFRMIRPRRFMSVPSGEEQHRSICHLWQISYSATRISVAIIARRNGEGFLPWPVGYEA